MDVLDPAKLATVSGGANVVPALNMAWQLFKSPSTIKSFHGKGPVPVPAAVGFVSGLTARWMGIGAVAAATEHALDEAVTPIRK